MHTRPPRDSARTFARVFLGRAPLVTLGLLLVGTGACAAKNTELPRDQSTEELPRWATDKLSVKRELARDLIDQGNTRLALDVIKDLRLADNVGDPELDMLQGIAMRDEGLYSEAERLLAAAREKMPRNAEVHEAMCVLRSDQGLVDEALDSCRRATELDPERASAFNNYGYLLMATGDLAGALAAMESAVDLDATESRYRNNLGLVQAANGRASDALRTFMSTGPRAVAHYNVGAALERFGAPTEALVYYGQALQFDPNLESAREAVQRLQSTEEK